MVARVFLLNIKKRGKAETFATKLACCSTTAVPWTMATIEKEIITSSIVRDFVLTLFTKFSTIMSIRDKNFSINHLVSAMQNTVVKDISLGIDIEVNKNLVKNLTDSIIPTGNTVNDYLAKNRWYIAVLLINVFSISSLKVMDDIKRPPVKNEGT
jgi:hypothetical protein